MLLLTGATGFLGGYLLRPLSDSGQTLRWLRPPGDRRTPVPTAHANGLAGDLTRPETLTVACDGVDTIVHLAAPWQPPPGQTPELVIAEGTRNLLAAARAAGVSRIVFVSAQGSGPGSNLVSTAPAGPAQGDAASRTSRDKNRKRAVRDAMTPLRNDGP